MKHSEIARATQPESPQEDFLSDLAEDWREYWWGMPSFDQAGDATPAKKITMNFLSLDDFREFCEKLGLPKGARADSAWFPHQEPFKGEFEFIGPKATTRYPVCIPSKGRWDVQKTGDALYRMGINHLFFVEETEADKYRDTLGEYGMSLARVKGTDQ